LHGDLYVGFQGDDGDVAVGGQVACLSGGAGGVVGALLVAS
jgi:hypothetical protein